MIDLIGSSLTVQEDSCLKRNIKEMCNLEDAFHIKLPKLGNSFAIKR